MIILFNYLIQKAKTEYFELSPTSKTVLMFWDVLESFTQEERRLFLQFVWGRTTLPSTTDHNTIFTIARFYDPLGQTNNDAYLPVARILYSFNCASFQV
jgi:hypothetical protein